MTQKEAHRMNQSYQTRLEAAFLHFLNENIRPDYINKVDAYIEHRYTPQSNGKKVK